MGEVDARRLAELIRTSAEVRDAVLDAVVGDKVSRTLLAKRLLREDLATKADVARLEERIGRLEERVARLEERVARLEERVSAMAKDLERLYSLYKTSLLAILISIFGTFLAQVLLRVLGV